MNAGSRGIRRAGDPGPTPLGTGAPDWQPSDRGELGATARSGALNLTGAAAAAVLGLLLTLAVTRLFTPEVAGVFFVAMTVFLLAESVAGLGAGVGAVYLLARRRALAQVAGLRAVFQVAAAPTVVASLLAATGVWLAAPVLAGQMIPESAGSATAAIRIAAVFVPAAVVLHLYVSAVRGLGRTRPFVVIERLARPGTQLAAVAAVGLATAGTAGAVAAAWAAPYLLASVVAVGWAGRLRRRLERTAGVSPVPPVRRDWVEFWRFAAPRGGTGVAQVGLQRLDLLLIAALLGPVEVAMYVAASRFLTMGQLANQAIGFAAQHRFAGRFATGEVDAIRRLYRITTGWLVLGSWPFLLLCVVYAGPVLALFGPEYPAAAPVLRVLCAVMLLGTGCGMVSMVLEMSGRSMAVLAQTVGALVINLALNLLLIPSLGLVGAGLAWAGAIVVNNLVPLWMVHRAYRLHPFHRGVLLPMAAAVGCFGCVPALAASLWGLPVSIPVTVAAAAGYAVLLWWQREPWGLIGFAAVLRRRGGAAP